MVCRRSKSNLHYLNGLCNCYKNLFKLRNCYKDRYSQFRSHQICDQICSVLRVCSCIKFSYIDSNIDINLVFNFECFSLIHSFFYFFIHSVCDKKCFTYKDILVHFVCFRYSYSYHHCNADSIIYFVDSSAKPSSFARFSSGYVYLRICYRCISFSLSSLLSRPKSAQEGL